MNQPSQTELTDHVYDGIREYDNPLPGWWTWLFIGSCAFSFFYWIIFHFGTEGRSVLDEFDRTSASVLELRFQEIGVLKPDRETILKYLNNPKFLTVGRVVYKTNCVSCHGANGEGNVGPNLTDDNWKNVKQIEDIARVIEQGAANGAMPAWRNRLSHINQIVLTAAYVATLRGSKPAGGKTPEGDPVGQWTRQSPLDHPLPFLVVAAVTGLMLFDFGYFREQLCIIACPYGRLNHNSLPCAIWAKAITLPKRKWIEVVCGS